VTFPRYFDSEEDLRQFCLTRKQQACPHCRKTGTLNLHGHLRGYSEQGGDTLALRGRRLFCSNRHRRPGCGRTVGLWLSGVLRNCILSLHTLWLFLTGILAGRSRADAFRRTGSGMHPMTAYRVFRRMERSQSRLRARLNRQVRSPEASGASSPLAATIAHLRDAFPHVRCPPAEYQLRFQTPFLA
jgi:hypothetical protein